MVKTVQPDKGIAPDLKGFFPLTSTEWLLFIVAELVLIAVLAAKLYTAGNAHTTFYFLTAGLGVLFALILWLYKSAANPLEHRLLQLTWTIWIVYVALDITYLLYPVFWVQWLPEYFFSTLLQSLLFVTKSGLYYLLLFTGFVTFLYDRSNQRELYIAFWAGVLIEVVTILTYHAGEPLTVGTFFGPVLFGLEGLALWCLYKRFHRHFKSNAKSFLLFVSITVVLFLLDVCRWSVVNPSLQPTRFSSILIDLASMIVLGLVYFLMTRNQQAN